MELTGMLLIMFAIASGFATFIENDYGTIAAKSRIYNARWFEVLLLLLAINMTGSIFKHKMYTKKKWTILLFHVSFLVIFLGAAATRYIGYEGSTRIREGATSNQMTSAETFIRVWAEDGGDKYYNEKKVLGVAESVEKFSDGFSIRDKSVQIDVTEYYNSAGETLIEGEGEEMLWLVISNEKTGRQDVYFENGDTQSIGGYVIGFNSAPVEGGINISSKGTELTFMAPDSVEYMNMMAGVNEKLGPDSTHQLQPMALYSIGGISLVVKKFYEKARIGLTSTGGQEGMSSIDAFSAKVTVGEKTKIIDVFGGKGYATEPSEINIDGINIKVSYGAKRIQLPFAIQLDDFQMDRYPGSNSPSSYASQVVVIDESKDLEMPYRIYMNNVLNYRGYRFFQSSYDPDELGTILSVNHDAVGTIITYIGYLMMTVGMFFTIFARSSRFRMLFKLSSKIRETRKSVVSVLIILGFVLFGSFSNQALADNSINRLPEIDKEHAAKFGKLLVQDVGGRIKPVNTLASEVLRKIAYKTSFEGQNPEQVFLGILAFPGVWDKVPFIKVKHDEVKNFLGVDGKRAAFNQIVDLSTGNYRLSQYVEKAYAKKPANQSKFDKEVIKVDERVNIFYMIYTGTFLTSFPIPGDINNTWVNSGESDHFTNEEEQLFVKGILSMYFTEVAKAVETGNWKAADEHLGYIISFQEKHGAEVIPSEGKVNMEILYNKINPFKRLAHYYLYVGFVLLVLHFINILNPKINFKWVIRIASILIVLLFVMHTAGLALRWSISGHAPWSNGYESLIYIGWATILAGLIFVKRSPVTLSVTAMLTALILSVAGMSWMDPEITTLVPVLKSYWLIIHVAIITASYGFLALGSLLGFFNLLLMIIKTKKNKERLDLTLTELSYIIEMTLIVGLFMLTIGTFLGGVWANESWGRYWGWDPKETWALVTVLAYSFIVHMRFIPGFRGNFSLSFAALIGYSSVLMTYFGVNYYLSGLHSYAAGDPVPVPTFVYYTLGVIAVVSILAFLSNRRHVVKPVKVKEE